MPMKMEYDTKENADIARWRKGTLVQEKKCPVFKKVCIGKKCMAYNTGMTYKQKKYIDGKYVDAWKITIPHCDSPLVTGYIEMEGNFP